MQKAADFSQTSVGRPLPGAKNAAQAIHVNTKLLLSLIPPLLGAGCMRQVTDTELTYPRYTGTAPWTIAGIRPGMTLEEVKKIKGEPARSLDNPPLDFQWVRSNSNGEFTVKVDAHGRITTVYGDALSAGDHTLVGSGASEEEVKALLGQGESKAMKSTGSFVIATPGKLLGAEHLYHNGDTTFRVIVMKDAGLTGVVAERK